MSDANIPACPQSNQLRGQNHDYHVIVTAMALKSFVVGLSTCLLLSYDCSSDPETMPS